MSYLGAFARAFQCVLIANAIGARHRLVQRLIDRVEQAGGAQFLDARQILPAGEAEMCEKIGGRGIDHRAAGHLAPPRNPYPAGGE